jgi:energy-converting hydrogenase Eha subunit A
VVDFILALIAGGIMAFMAKLFGGTGAQIYLAYVIGLTGYAITAKLDDVLKELKRVKKGY